MRTTSAKALEPYNALSTKLTEAILAFEREVLGPPCSTTYFRQLQRVALLPDGLNDFLYMRDNEVICSSNSGIFSERIDFGEPDLQMKLGNLQAELWVDRNVKALGYDNMKASIGRAGPLGVVIPTPQGELAHPEWVAVETAFVSETGNWWHRKGTKGLYEATRNTGISSSLPSYDLKLRDSTCLGNGFVCAATEASILAVLGMHLTFVAAFLALALFVSVCAGLQTKAAISRNLSFESRFRRNFTAQSVECLYQPILDMKTGEIAACEVLARWRDVDDKIVFPDKFIPLIEKFGLTLAFTKLVVERAFRDLTENVHLDRRLRVTFNLFPRDLEEDKLIDIFRIFEGTEQRFELVAELVESEAIDVELVQVQIEKMKRAGINTYIDDFGTGYSNMQNLVDLSVDGVKIDRGFAMAASGSVKARMLDLAIEMVEASGKMLIVEGIETQERLDYLHDQKPAVDFVQGYHISRPLEVRAFSEFLTKRDTKAVFRGVHRPAEQAPQRPYRTALSLVPATV
ncbi:EAL domain-containing protein [Fulvimarina sp. MAC8]|uniref:EAL domain-containing protein n=1 Tax=Fulvimarina sp. MAC8 TaxID=3162874 RepID=UPI0032EEE4C1